MAHALAGKPAPKEQLINIPELVAAYYSRQLDISDPAQRVSFGTSGHRGSPLHNTFNQDHVLAIAQAICEHRAASRISGPVFVGTDTRALSKPSQSSALEVFLANGVDVKIHAERGFVPTPVLSHAVLSFNRKNSQTKADGVVFTASHNPPEDGGIKYNPPSGGPADAVTTKAIQDRANQILENKLQDVKRVPLEWAQKTGHLHEFDFLTPYVGSLSEVLDMRAIASSGLKIGVDALGGASLAYWEAVAEKYNLNLEVVNSVVDPSFAFMPLDKDGKLRMDCSSSYSMAGLIKQKNRFDLALGNDPDADRHGIVTKSFGLMNPNHYLASAVWYLFGHRSRWNKQMAIGKTVVTSSMIDRVAGRLKRKVVETPVGFKWFVDGLLSGSLAVACEESAGASLLRKNGRVWTTDKDGIVMGLLAAEMTARTGMDPSDIYRKLESEFSASCFERVEIEATPEAKSVWEQNDLQSIEIAELGGEPVTAKITHAADSAASIGGLKVVSENGWIALRPSGTESVFKLYAESFKGKNHLNVLIEQAQELLGKVTGTGLQSS